MTRHLRTLCARIRSAKRGAMRVAYATDAAGNVDATIVKGNGWRTQSDRHALGYVSADVTKARTILRRRGWKGTLGEAESILAEALVMFDQGARAVASARKRRQRSKAAADGCCIVCGREPAREGRKTCALCNARAAERVARRRLALKEANVTEAA